MWRELKVIALVVTSLGFFIERYFGRIPFREQLG